MVRRNPECQRLGMADWLDSNLYPFRSRPFSTADGRLSYLDEGAGSPVLLVHGTPSWSFEWRNVIAGLVEGRRCVAPDHLGFGLSDKPRRASLDPRAHSMRLVQLVEELDLSDITLVVHDFGGPIGLGAALRLAARVRRIVVLNSWMWPIGDDPAVVKLARVINSPLGAMLYRWFNFSPRVLLPAAFGDRRTLTKTLHRHYLGPFERRADREGPYALARALAGADTYYAELWAARHELASKLTDLVWGEKDPFFGNSHLEQWVSAFPGARVHRLPKVGHFIAEEAPEAVIDAIRAA
jgi:pimeloyl-ACP methyl ester carboxylesterase